jgi:hypothetical protein
MAGADTVFVERAMRRIFRGMLALSAAGTLAALWLAGWRNGLSFLLGSAGAYLNLYWLHRLVEALGPGAHPVTPQSRGQQLGHPGGIGFQPVRAPFGYRPGQAEAYPTAPETEALRRRPRKGLLVVLATRYLLLGLAGYVIVKVFGLGLVALLLGLFVPAAAVLAEILYELVYAGT